MATSKFNPREVPDQVSQEVRQYLDDMLAQIAVLLNPAADYIDDATIAHTDEDETITADWTFSGTLALAGATITGLSSDDLSDVASIAMLDEAETVSANWTFTGSPRVHNLLLGSGNHSDGDSILTFALDRSWEIKQGSADASSILELHSNNNGKRFHLTNSSDQVNFAFAPNSSLPYFRIYDGVGTDYVNFAMGTADLSLTASNVADLELVSFTGALDLRDGMDLRIRDAGDTDWCTFGHDGTDFNVTPVNTALFNFRDGVKVRIRDTTDADYVDIYHTGILGRIDCNTPLQFAQDINLVEHNDLRLACSVGTIQSTSARVKAELQTLADDATGVFMNANNSTYRLHILVNSYNATATCMWFQTSTQTPQVVFQGSNVSIAATVNPDVDTDVNIWHSSSTGVSIKNRLGSSRTFTLYSIGL